MLGIGTLAKKVFGTPNDRKIKATRPTIEKINALEDEFQALSDEGIIEKTESFKKRVAEGESLEDLLPEAFGVVWEACRRLAERGESWPVWDQDARWDMVPYDVQLMGAIILHQGKIAEMATGEGKTLVAIFPLYLNHRSGKGNVLC